MPNLKKSVTILLTLLVLSAALGGCGKRAAHVDAPGDAEQDDFPFVYPDPDTDPHPPGTHHP